MAKAAFGKPWLSYAGQRALLESRGLIVQDHPAAEAFLSHLNYYRFSGYCLAFESKRHEFLAGTTFEQVAFAYQFDSTLRDLLTEALELVEVDFRGAIAYRFSESHGAFGHTIPARFHSSFDHGEFLELLHRDADRSSELFVAHFKTKYDEFPDLPIWVITELASFGCMSKMYEGMRTNDQSRIAQRYGLQTFVLVSLMHHLVYIRNLCAHHLRLWDRRWNIKAAIPAGKKWQAPNDVDNGLLFSTLLFLRLLLQRIRSVEEFALQWKDRVEDHIAAAPAAPNALGKMGFTANWQDHPIWVG